MFLFSNIIVYAIVTSLAKDIDSTLLCCLVLKGELLELTWESEYWYVRKFMFFLAI